MNKQDVIKLMESSKTENEWNDNCDKVRASFFGEYPSFWFTDIVLSGLANRVASRFGKTDEIKISQPVRRDFVVNREVMS